MKKILILLFILISANKLLADIEFPKDTLWVGYVPYTVSNAIFSHDETKVFVNTNVGFSVLDANTGKTIEELTNVGFMASESSDGNSFMNYKLEKYDSKTRQLLWKCPLRDTANFKMLTFGFSDNGKYLVVAYYRRNNKADNDTTNVDIYDVDSQVNIKSLNNSSVYYNVAISNNCEYLLYSSSVKKGIDNYDNSILYHIPTGKNLKQLYERKNGSGNTWVQNFQFNQISNKNNYAIAKWKDFITVLNMNTLESFVYTPSGGGYYDSMLGLISPDEKLLVSGGVKNGILELFNLQKKEIIYTLPRFISGETNYALLSKSNGILISGYGVGILIAIDLTKNWTGISLENAFNFSISPNPTNNKLILTNPQNHQINTLTAYDILGRTYPLSANGNEVDISALAAGKYFLKVGLADGSFLDFGFVKE